MKNVKKIVILILITIVIAGVTACQKTSMVSDTKKENIMIGAILPLTGDMATYGQQERNGIEMAVEQVNQQVFGGKILAVTFEDSESDPKKAVAAYQKLFQNNQIKYYVTCCSGMTLAISPLIEQNKNIIFSIAAHPEITKNPYIIRNLPTTNDYVGALGQVIQVKNLQKMGIIYANNDFGIGVKDTLVSNFSRLNYVQEYYNGNETDFKTQIIKVLNSQPDAVLIAGDGNRKLGLLTKQLREMGFDGLILGTAEFNVPDVLEAAGQAAEGVVFSDFYIDYENNNLAKKFKVEMLKKYNSEPSFDSILGYNEILILADAINRTKDYENVDQLLNTLKYNLDVKIVGGYITGIPTREIKYNLRLMTIKDGQAVVYE
jgi:branched-chain amino acid transport system substrate-binding protein